MPRARKYTDAQRSEILRLHYLGHSAYKIVEKCAAGETNVDPFQIPRRSVAQLIQNANKRAGTGTITTLSDAETEQSVEANTKRIQALLSRELGRLERKSQTLSMDDLNRLERVRAMNERLRTSQARSRTRDTSSKRQSKKKDSQLDGLASRIGSGDTDQVAGGQGNGHLPSVPSRHGGTPSTPTLTPTQGSSSSGTDTRDIEPEQSQHR